MDVVVKRFEVYWVNLDPTLGSEINKKRPCIIISSDDLNRVLNTVIIAPLTSTVKNYPTRISCFVDQKNGQIALDQIRAVDKQRLIKKMAILDAQTKTKILEIMAEMFA